MKLSLPSVLIIAPLILLAAGCASKPAVQAPPANPVTTVVGVGAPTPIKTIATPALAGAAPAAPIAVAPPAAVPVVSTPKTAPVASGNYQPEAGLYRCEEKQTVALKRVLDDGKKIVINWKAKDYELALLPTNTGAVRYESKAAGFAWIYVVGKAFLLDSKKGNRIANDCKI